MPSSLTYRPTYAVDPESALPTLREHMLVDGFNHVVDLERSHGSYFVEARTGREYLDLFSCIASMPVGLNHPKMTEPAFVEYLGKVALNKLSNSDIYCSEMATFVRTFFELAVPPTFKYSFFIEGGALAIENAVKVAMDWKVRKNFQKGWRTERGHQVMHFDGAFHGRSGYTMSLTNTDPSKTSLYAKFSWPRISHPSVRFPLTPAELDRVVEAEELSIRQMRQAFINHPDDICAIIIEPIQGEGGDRHVRPEFFQALRTLADEFQALLIFDEVQSGMGITGHWWAHQAYGVQPDIMCFGKKTQVCGIVVSDRIDDVPDNVFHTSSRINSTWGGNLVDMVRVTRYLEIMAEDNLIQNAAAQGAYLHQHLNRLAEEVGSNVITNVRGLGLMRAFDLPSTAMRNEFLDRMFQNGVLMVGCGQSSVRFRPPLTITSDELDEGVEIIRTSLQQVL